MSKGSRREDDQSPTSESISRRQFLRRAACGGLALSGACAVLAACADLAPEEEAQTPAPTDTPLPSPQATDDTWTPPPPHTGDLPAGTGEVDIRGIGSFSFDAGAVKTLRPDLLQPGHFSLFDILTHLGERGEIELKTHFDESLDTHVIDTINGQSGWWYNAHYSQGWWEHNAFRMDTYPYKNNSRFRLYIEQEQRLADIYRAFEEEVARLAGNGGKVIIPELVKGKTLPSRTIKKREPNTFDIYGGTLCVGLWYWAVWS